MGRGYKVDMARRAITGSTAGAVGTTTLTTVRCLTATTTPPTTATTTLVSVWCVPAQSLFRGR